MTDKHAWEAICRRCGQCCFEKIEFDGEIYYTPVPCPYLDLQSRQCTVYPRRHRLRSDCAPLDQQILEAGMLPEDCPYVANIKGYRAPRLWPDDEE